MGKFETPDKFAARDEFSARLKQDAEALDAEVSAELRIRIDASLRGVETARPEQRRKGLSAGGLWWISSLTGLAAAAAVIGYVNFAGPNSAPASPTVADNQTVPDSVPYPGDVPVYLPLLSPKLAIESAEFTSPLEEELLKLQSDLDKARMSVSEDVDFTF